jgi:hypothetical protein
MRGSPTLSTTQRGSACLLAVMLAACGATSGDTKVDSAADKPEIHQKRPAKRESVPMIEADVGTLDEVAVKQSFAAAKEGIVKCLDSGSKRLSYLAGEIDVVVRVGKEGVLYALPSRSSLGDRATEECIVQVLKRQPWPAPQGGREAEARQHLSTTARGRAAVELRAGDLGAVAAKAREEIARCRKGIQVTAYIDPDGKPTSAGASLGDPESQSGVECAIAAVMKLRFPSPGSWMGKVTVGE